MISNVTRWLHTMYPLGTVERLPIVNDDYTTRVKNLYVVGDLSGIPLLKFSQHTGSKVAHRIIDEIKSNPVEDRAVYDCIIIGGGVSGISAALECEKAGLNYLLLEAAEVFNTIVNFPKKKPIYLYPTEMQPDGDLEVTAEIKEDLLDELNEQVKSASLNIRTGINATHVERKGNVLRVKLKNEDDLQARHVVLAIGRSGNYRKMGIPGQDLGKVYNRLHDPAEFSHQKVLVVGGGDSALEAAISMAQHNAEVTLAYRGNQFSRPKPDNIEQIEALSSKESGAGKIRLLMNTEPKEITQHNITLLNKESKESETIDNDHVFSLIGREAPLDFFRKSGIPIQGEWTPTRIISFAAFLIFCVWMYNWKGGGTFAQTFDNLNWFPFNMPEVMAGISVTAKKPYTLWGTLAISMGSPSFYYTLAYSSCVGIFGLKRILKRKTPYVTVQTTCLFLIQFIPLFLLPEIIFPLMGHNGMFDSGFLGTIADNLFPVVTYGHGREYWRAYGFILAWPLFLYNFFTDQPMLWWLIIGSIQTFVIIPTLIFFYGKGSYCGWICSCGALAETLGDEHRQKMPHGPFWSKLNMAGQIILWIAVALMGVRIYGWIFPESVANTLFDLAVNGTSARTTTFNPINYKWVVDTALAGVLGVGFYFWFSGRVWCRFFCPLAALMHIFAKFSRFRIIPEKKKCISCNVCTSVCHQGIDVMNFANKGVAMEDPECVRCSACVQSCPTGVLQFGQVDQKGDVIRYDKLPASPVLMAEALQSKENPTK